MTTTNVISTPEITGNIGSCKAENTTYDINSFYRQSITVNSCSGQVISDFKYFDWNTVISIVIIVIFFTILQKIIHN